jgi:hypothetical protein
MIATVLTNTYSTDEELWPQFKNYKKNFIDIDNDVKKLKGAIRERNSVKRD